MKVNGKHYRTIWMQDSTIYMIDQNLLPFKFEIKECKDYKETCQAIKDMTIRGAGAIGATGAYAMAQAFIENSSPDFLKQAKQEIESTRPTAKNLFTGINFVYDFINNYKMDSLVLNPVVINKANEFANNDIASSKQIGEYGNFLIKKQEKPFRIMTRCNAGWLAFVDYGTALSPIYQARDSGKPLHVLVTETSPRLQGARLTAWELQNENIPYKIIPDGSAAFFMSKGDVDLIITGADRIAANGDTANKIGTLELAICANEFKIPFYIAAPTTTFDLKCYSGKQIPIELRSEDEVLKKTGLTNSGIIETILVCTPGSSALNPSFDVTPAKYIKGIITEKGIVKPNNEEIKRLFVKQIITNTSVGNS